LKTLNRALIIDDDPDLCNLLKSILTDVIPEVNFVHTIALGHQALADIKPDIIFLDNNLPDGQGVNYIQSLKAMCASARLVVITAADYNKSIAMESGADDFIEKPLTQANIREALFKS
jgi:DNA-binding response OmpR family regulator